MPRPSQIDEQRRRLLPVVQQTFCDLGYRRTTTAELAHRCEVRENILYRLWSDKKAMFLAAIDAMFEQRMATWSQLFSDKPNSHNAAEELIDHEAEHMGEFGFYRIVFTALGETDDPDIRDALVRMYGQFHRFACNQLRSDRRQQDDTASLSVNAAAWALIGLATVSNIIRELDLLSPAQRKQIFKAIGRQLLAGSWNP